MRAMLRYSSTCIGELLSHAANRADSSPAMPARFATNQSAASSAITVRTRSSLAFIGSSQPRHTTPAVNQRAAQIFLDHVRGNAELLADLRVAQSLPVLQR